MTAVSPDVRCSGCFTLIPRGAPCPYCGPAARESGGTLLLPRGTLLQNRYVVGRVLGKPGGFGITYLGWYRRETRVAIKEYLPRDLAGRATDHATVAAHSREDAELFSYGLAQFTGEARTLTQLDHPNIVRVRHHFEANGTAYLVMDYYAGLSLAEYLERQGGRLPEAQARALLQPILDGLRAVHAKGFLHRDIKPQNIYLARTEGGGARPILLDFGSARQAMGERTRSLSVVLTPGFAPFEQYHRKGRQGPWSDVYAAAAVLYRMVTGVAPPEANERMAGDALQPATAYGVSPALSQSLAGALALLPEARPQTVQAFQASLVGASQGVSGDTGGSPPQPEAPGPTGAREPAPDTNNPFNPQGRFTRMSWLAWHVLMVLLGGVYGVAIAIAGVGSSEFEGAIGIAAIVSLVPSFIFIIRRLHDLGAAGWWSLCMAVPYVNILFLLILLFKGGEPAANRFGPPRPTQRWERIIGIVGVVLFALTALVVVGDMNQR